MCNVIMLQVKDQTWTVGVLDASEDDASYIIQAERSTAMSPKTKGKSEMLEAYKGHSFWKQHTVCVGAMQEAVCS